MKPNLKLLTRFFDKNRITLAFRKYRSPSSGVVLALHRVLPEGEAEDFIQPKSALTNTVFERLLIFLRSEFRIVSLAQILNHPEERDEQPRVAITFDHGWSDTYTYAYPLLLRYDVPATAFLCPGLMSDGQMLPEERFAQIWRWCVKHQHIEHLLRDLRKWGLNGGEAPVWHAWSPLLERLALYAKLLMLSHLENTYSVPRCKERRFLNWEEVRTMQRNNISFGSQTAHHCTLTAEQHPFLGEELRRSRETIEFQLQEEIRYLAYPNGLYDRRVMEAACQAGYSHCFTADQGSLRRNLNRFAIPRISIDTLMGNCFYPMHASGADLRLQQVGGHLS
jgi:peptidoglycan/xylan/chitin deacetylase (PgdA/CDA1 family)